MPEIIEALLVSEALVGILVFIATWLLKTYLDDSILKAIIKIAIRVAHEFLENTDFETHEFIHAFIAKLHASKFDTDKAEKYLLDEEELLKQWKKHEQRILNQINQDRETFQLDRLTSEDLDKKFEKGEDK